MTSKLLATRCRNIFSERALIRRDRFLDRYNPASEAAIILRDPLLEEPGELLRDYKALRAC